MADYNQTGWPNVIHTDQGTGGFYIVSFTPSMHPSVDGNVLLFQIKYYFLLPPDVHPPNTTPNSSSYWDLCVPGLHPSLLVDDVGSWLSRAGVLFDARNDILQMIFGSTWTSEAIRGIAVQIEATRVQPDIDEAELSMRECRLTQKPARLEVVEVLEKAVVSDAEREMSCAVCLEEFALGSELTKMPCSHAFHGDCIVKWLQYQCVCPLCRFELPSSVMLSWFRLPSIIIETRSHSLVI